MEIVENLIESTWNQIVFTIFRLIWIQANVRLDPNQSKNGNYNLISGCFNKIQIDFSLCIYEGNTKLNNTYNISD